MSKIAISLVFLALALLACAGSAPPRLAPVGDVIPAGVSLEGRWRLRTGTDDAEKQIRTAEYRSSRRGDEPSVYVFLRTGNRLKITQTIYGLFVSFDRSVVEEYRFREHRIVNVGPIEADRASGWSDGKYVVRTLDNEGALLEETYLLQAGGDELVRTVSIDYDDEEILSLKQVYERLD
jgi:hypothetical protein